MLAGLDIFERVGEFINVKAIKGLFCMLLVLNLLSGCFGDEKESEKAAEEKHTEATEKSTKKETQSEQSANTESNVKESQNSSTTKQQAAGEKNNSNKGEKEMKEIEEVLKIEKNPKLEEKVEKEKSVIDAEYSVIKELGISKLILYVNEDVELNEAKKLAEDYKKILLEENPDFLPVVTIYKNDKEFYSILNAK